MSGQLVAAAFGTNAPAGAAPAAANCTNTPFASSVYNLNDSPSCRVLLRHAMALALSLAAPSAGSNMLARMPMMAMTTRSSMRVKARCNRS